MISLFLGSSEFLSWRHVGSSQKHFFMFWDDHVITVLDSAYVFICLLICLCWHIFASLEEKKTFLHIYQRNWSTVPSMCVLIQMWHQGSTHFIGWFTDYSFSFYFIESFWSVASSSSLELWLKWEVNLSGHGHFFVHRFFTTSCIIRLVPCE